jgi:hypothetical protein
VSRAFSKAASWILLSPQLLLQDGKVDFEGYINFNDAGAEYKFTVSQNGREYERSVPLL